MSRNAHRVATVDELSENGDRIIEEVAGQEIAIFRVGDELHAIANYCVHQGGPLCEGPTTGKKRLDPDTGAWRYEEAESVVRCPWHGWRFDVTTGESLQSDRYVAPTYDVEVRNDEVYVLR